MHKENEIYEPLIETNQVLQKSPSHAWVFFAIMTAVCIGITNFFHGELSAKFSIAGSFPLFQGIIIMWVLYYAIVHYQNSQLQAMGQPVPRSVYLRADARFNWPAISGILARGASHIILICTSYLSLRHANLAGISTGVITSLYTSGVIFTAILYFLVYHERLTCRVWCGMLVIIAGGVFIGAGKPSDDFFRPEIDEENVRRNTLLSIFYACLCGVSFAVNSLVMKYYVQKFNYGVIQLNLDGYMVCVPFLLTGYLIYGPSRYSYTDLAMQLGSAFFSVLGTASMTHALKTGPGGPIQAIDSLKCLVTLLLDIWIKNSEPTLMQLLGIACGILGVVIVSRM